MHEADLRRGGIGYLDPSQNRIATQHGFRFLGYAYAIHHRAVQEHGFSEKRNAGAIDLGQAVYLTMCDRFITNDRAQHRALRLLNVFNTKRCTQVLSYDAFRKRLLPFG